VRRFVTGDHGAPINFTPALRLKDIEYALRLARSLDSPGEFGEVAARLYRKLCERGHSRENESRIVDVVRG
jgi:3-hydroxyisobutyrate dehydrogenase-like beta-hydroxyacid dehydrogenase